VLPLVDLATKLKREPEPITKRTCILVLELEVSGECWPIGVLTDGVATLLDIEVDKRRPAPKFGEGVDVRFIEYLLPSERGILPALDVQRIFASDELAALARSAEAAAAST
jgi:purine-binding chemotaxis protein CheW